MSDPLKDAVLYEGPFPIKFAGRDVTAWRWIMNGREVVVEIAETAMALPDEGLSERVAKARQTKGESEVERMLDWDVPLDRVTLYTDSE